MILPDELVLGRLSGLALARDAARSFNSPLALTPGSVLAEHPIAQQFVEAFCTSTGAVFIYTCFLCLNSFLAFVALLESNGVVGLDRNTANVVL